MHGARLWERDLDVTGRFLTEVMDFRLFGSEGGWHRFGLAEGGSRNQLEIRQLPDQPQGRWGVGSVHHIAWRVPNEKIQLAMRAKVADAGLRPTEVIDRFWFKSVYFREPGGVLFELATDGPGFTVDEDPQQLGGQLILPPWLEEHRTEIEAKLPPLRLPEIQEYA